MLVIYRGMARDQLAIPFLLFLLFFPYSTFPCMILVWSLFALIDSIAAWPGIQKYVVQKDEESQTEEQQ